MSNEIAFSIPPSRAIRAAPTTPAAGPETSASAGWAAASARLTTPPEERITSGSGRPDSTQARPSASK